MKALAALFCAIFLATTAKASLTESLTDQGFTNTKSDRFAQDALKALRAEGIAVSDSNVQLLRKALSQIPNLDGAQVADQSGRPHFAHTLVCGSLVGGLVVNGRGGVCVGQGVRALAEISAGASGGLAAEITIIHYESVESDDVHGLFQNGIPDAASTGATIIVGGRYANLYRGYPNGEPQGHIQVTAYSAGLTLDFSILSAMKIY